MSRANQAVITPAPVTPSDGTVTDAKIASPGLAQSSIVALDSERLTSGEATIHRHLAQTSLTLTGGALELVFFTARKTETVNNMRLATSNTAAAGLTLARCGLYSVGATTLTLLAAIANDTTLFAAGTTAYTRALTASASKVAGQRYAIGLLCVGTTMPSIPSTFFNGPSAEMGQTPQLGAQLASQSDLPSSVTLAGLTNRRSPYYAVVLP